MEQDSKEKLRQEIAQLSNLIASSQSRNAIITNPSIYSFRNGGFTTTRQWLHSSVATNLLNQTYKNPFTFSSVQQNGRRPQLPQYPNPFQSSTMKGYSKQVFPDRPSSSYYPSSSVSGVGRIPNARISSPYKLERKNVATASLGVTVVGQGLVCPVKESTSVNATNTNLTKNSMPAPAAPKSVYINPSHFLKSSGEDGSSSIRIRPHLNPAFQTNYDVQQIDKTDADVVEAKTTSTSMSGPIFQNAASTSTAVAYQQQSFQLATSTVQIRTPVKTTYKLDRRIKRTPPARKRSILVPKISLISMRLVSRRAFTTTFTRLPYVRPSKSISTNFSHRLLQKSYTRRYISPRAFPVKGLKPKSVVHIDGSKYLRKNNGKTLKRMSLKGLPANVVCIKGRQYITRNGGKSLKGVTEIRRKRIKSLSLSQTQSFTLSQPSQGVKLANRAIAKSKLTLTQRTWRKKRFCVFYNRFGECKKNEAGNCPYIHDKNQLTICPKFVVGKCTNSECKLSHDLKVGRMMPCQFYNKSECSREGCPYPHVKSTSVQKKSKTSPNKTAKEKAANDNDKTETPTVPASDNDQPKRKKKEKAQEKSSKEDEEGKARYFQETLSSQPMVSIVPRRIPLDLLSEPGSSKCNGSVSTSSSKPIQLPKNSCEVLTKDSKAEKVPGTNAHHHDSLTTIHSHTGGVRSRLMSKVTTLRDKLKKKESTAPTFLSFK